MDWLFDGSGTVIVGVVIGAVVGGLLGPKLAARFKKKD